MAHSVQPFDFQGEVNIRALYVGNLPYSVGWQDLKDLFRNAGNVIRADIPTDWQNRSKGFGTIVMGSVEEARKAASMYLLFICEFVLLANVHRCQPCTPASSGTVAA